MQELKINDKLIYSFFYHFGNCYRYEKAKDPELSESEEAMHLFGLFDNLISSDDSDYVAAFADEITDILIKYGLGPDDYIIKLYVLGKNTPGLFADFFFEEDDLSEETPLFTLSFLNFEQEIKWDVKGFLKGIDAVNRYEHWKEIEALVCDSYAPEDRENIIKSIMDMLHKIMGSIHKEQWSLLFHHFYGHDTMELSFHDWKLHYRIFDHHGIFSCKEEEEILYFEWMITSPTSIKIMFNLWEITIKLITSPPSAKKQKATFSWKFSKIPDIPTHIIEDPYEGTSDDIMDDDDDFELIDIDEFGYE